MSDDWHRRAADGVVAVRSAERRHSLALQAWIAAKGDDIDVAAKELEAARRELRRARMGVAA